jgi:hypothetical protein
MVNMGSQRKSEGEGGFSGVEKADVAAGVGWGRGCSCCYSRQG